MYTSYHQGILNRVIPGSHSVVQVVKMVQKDPKDKDAEFESFVFFGSFCTTLTTQKTECGPGFRKQCCLQQVPLQFTERALICLKETSSEGNEACTWTVTPIFKSGSKSEAKNYSSVPHIRNNIFNFRSDVFLIK